MPFFNKYKIKRRWSRRRERNDSGVFYGGGKTLDFAKTSEGKRNNPYRAGSTPNTKRRILFALGGVGVLAMAGILFFHPFFTITEARMEIRGLERIDLQEFLDNAGGITQAKLLYFLPRNNYLLLNTSEMRDILMEKYPLAEVTITKKFPHTLTIEAAERLSTVIYDNGKQYAYVGMDGKVVETARPVYDTEWRVEEIMSAASSTFGVSTTEREHIPDEAAITAELGAYPIIYDPTDKEVAINAAVLGSEIPANVIEWYSKLKEASLPMQYVRLDTLRGDGRIYTKSGLEIQAMLAERTTEQFQALQLVLREQIQNQPAHRIDVRFPDHVFWE